MLPGGSLRFLHKPLDAFVNMGTLFSRRTYGPQAEGRAAKDSKAGRVRQEGRKTVNYCEKATILQSWPRLPSVKGGQAISVLFRRNDGCLHLHNRIRDVCLKF